MGPVVDAAARCRAVALLLAAAAAPRLACVAGGRLLPIQERDVVSALAYLVMVTRPAMQGVARDEEPPVRTYALPPAGSVDVDVVAAAGGAAQARFACAAAARRCVSLSRAVAPLAVTASLLRLVRVCARRRLRGRWRRRCRRRRVRRRALPALPLTLGALLVLATEAAQAAALGAAVALLLVHRAPCRHPGEVVLAPPPSAAAR